MPIHIPIQLADGTTAGHIHITCIAPRGTHADSVNGYRASIVDHPGDIDRDVYVEHRYGDHWTVLLTKVLQAYEMQHPR